MLQPNRRPLQVSLDRWLRQKLHLRGRHQALRPHCGRASLGLIPSSISRHHEYLPTIHPLQARLWGEAVLHLVAAEAAPQHPAEASAGVEEVQSPGA